MYMHDETAEEYLILVIYLFFYFCTCVAMATICTHCGGGVFMECNSSLTVGHLWFFPPFTLCKKGQKRYWVISASPGVWSAIRIQRWPHDTWWQTSTQWNDNTLHIIQWSNKSMYMPHTKPYTKRYNDTTPGLVGVVNGMRILSAKSPKCDWCY